MIVVVVKKNSFVEEFVVVESCMSFPVLNESLTIIIIVSQLLAATINL